jgi:hypothetical protein
LDLPDGTNGRASGDKEGEEEQRGAQGEEAGGAGWVVAAGTGAAAGEERGEGTPRGAISLYVLFHRTIKFVYHLQYLD